MAPEPQPLLTAWVSGQDIAHLDPEGCTGLDMMREHGRDPRLIFRPTAVARAADLAALAVTEVQFSLCRLCAVDPVLQDVFTAHQGQPGPRVFATFTHARPPARLRPRYPLGARPAAKRRIASQAPADRSPEELDRLRRLRSSADDAVRRVATVAGLELTDTPAGLAAYGFVPTALTAALAGVVHVEVRTTVTARPSAETVTTFWSLVKNAAPVPEDAPPEMDPWYVAELIQSPPA